MLDLDFDVGIIFLDARADGGGNAARNAVTAPCGRRVVNGIFLVITAEIDSLRLENCGELLERDDEIDVASHGTAARFQLLRRARSDKDHARVGTELFDGARRCDHGRKRAGYFIHHIGELQLCKHTPRGAAGSQQEREFPRCDFRRVVVRLGGRAHICAVRHLVHFLETDVFERSFDFPERNVRAELTDDGGRDFRHDFIPLLDRADQLEDLRLIGNRAERAADHALTAADALLRVDARAPEPVAGNRLDAARLRARTRSVRDRLVRAGGFALPALNALVLIDDGFPRLCIHGNRALRTDRHAISRNAAAALVAHFILVLFAAIARRGNDLHERRFVVAVRDIARVQPVCDVRGAILRIERHTHRKTDALRRDRAFAVNALAIHGRFRRRDLIRDFFQIARDVFRFKRNFGDLDKDLPPQFFYRSFQTSHFHNLL